MADNDVSSRSAFANGYVSGCIETMTMVVETLRDSSNIPHAVLRASMILKRMRNDPDELRRRIYVMIDGGASSVDDPRDAEIAQLRADLAKLSRALADERAAVAIAHERIAEVTAERDARPEISREDARAWTADGIPYGEQVRAGAAIDEALRAHAAGSGAAEASEPSPPPTAPPLLEWGPDGPRLSEYERKRLEREAEDALGGVCDECGGYLYVGEYGSIGMCPACKGSGRKEGSDA